MSLQDGVRRVGHTYSIVPLPEVFKPISTEVCGYGCYKGHERINTRDIFKLPQFYREISSIVKLDDGYQFWLTSEQMKGHQDYLVKRALEPRKEELMQLGKKYLEETQSYTHEDVEKGIFRVGRSHKKGAEFIRWPTFDEFCGLYLLKSEVDIGWIYHVHGN